MNNKEKLREYIKKFQSENQTKSYDETVPLINEIEHFLFERLKDEPNDVDYISALASAQLELRKGEENSIKLLEDFLTEYKNDLSDREKARIYTNLAFYYRESYTIEKEPYMLKMAVSCNSDYPETYHAFGLDYFDKDDFSEAEKYFEKAKNISSDFRYMFSYAVTLFMSKQYQKAKTVFETINQNHHCEDLDYALVCCEAKLGNKESCLSKLNVLKQSLFKNELKEISEYEIAVLYYELEEYEQFSEVFDDKKDQWWIRDMWEYFYALYAQGRTEDFDNLVNTELNKALEDVAEYQAEEIGDDYTEEERKEDIEETKKEIKALKEITSKIKNDGYRPEVELKIYPDYGCYLIDCIRHQKVN